jgi:hypothetical protein
VLSDKPNLESNNHERLSAYPSKPIFRSIAQFVLAIYKKPQSNIGSAQESGKAAVSRWFWKSTIKTYLRRRRCGNVETHVLLRVI